jgi:hypothetical protein
MNLVGRGKRKFAFQAHVLKKIIPSLVPIRKSEQLAKTDNVKTSPNRQARKKSELILEGKLSASPSSQTFHP